MGLSNPHIANKVKVVRGMVEDEETQEAVLKFGKVDTIISEPIGVMLLHERMASVNDASDERSSRSYWQGIYFSNLVDNYYRPGDIFIYVHLVMRLCTPRRIKKLNSSIRSYSVGWHE
jgi:hypothetical protein